MKIYKLIFVTVFSLILAGCQDFLEFAPESEKPAEKFFIDESDAEAAIYAAYGIVSHWDLYGGQAHLAAFSVPSDNSIAFGFGPLFAFEQFYYSVTDGRINAIWRNRYQAINLSNQLISNLPGISMSESKKILLEAEARFLRALHYAILVRAYGSVPIVTSVPVGPESNIREPKEAVYDLIEEDLQFAADHLPDSWDEQNTGRATKWAAKAFLAKAHLYQAEWQEVKSLTDEIINNSGHRLYTDRGDSSFYYLFRVEQEHNVESLFEAQSNGIEGDPNGISSGRQYGQVVGPIPWGWGNVVPTDDLAQAFDAAGDSIRKSVTIFYAGDVTLDGDTINKNEDAVPTVKPARYFGKAYVPINVNPDAPHWLRVAEQNVRLMRFAEVLLMNAEAAHYTGGDVATPLNKIRARVGLEPIANPTLDDIYRERRLELATEQDRFFDLIRTGRAAEILGPFGFEAGKHELFPIPAQEIELTDFILEQNPGWN